MPSRCPARTPSIYLQGQVSQELRQLAVGASRWTLLLQPNGRVDVLARVWRTDDDTYVLDTDDGFGDELLARINRFRIRVKADVEPVAWRCLAVRGTGGEHRPRWCGRRLVGPGSRPARAESAAARRRRRRVGCRPGGGADRGRLAGDGRRDRAGGADPRRDRGRAGRRRLQEGVLPRPGAGRADGLAGGRGAAPAAHPHRGRGFQAGRSGSRTTGGRWACSRASPAPAPSAT